MKKLTSINEPRTSRIESEIIYAIQYSQYNKLALYLRHNYNINIISKDGRNGLFYALDIKNSFKRYRMMKYLLNHGISPFHKEKMNGYTVLHETIARQQLDSFQYLLDEVSDEIDWHSLDKHGRTILHQAVESNNIIILEELITIMNRYNISVDLIDQNGLTPYLLAIKLHRRDMADMLLKKGRASRFKCDLQTHRSAREWETIGMKENYLILRQKHLQEINDAKRKGQITRVNQLKQLYFPLSSLSQRRDSYSTITTRSDLITKSSSSLDQLSPTDRLELFSNSQLDKQTYQWEHLPPINTLPRPKVYSSFDSLIDLFQRAQQ